MELAAFRDEIKSWLAANVPTSLYGLPLTIPSESTSESVEIVRAREQYLKGMSSRGYTAPRWPKAYGGAGLSADEAHVLQEELDALRLPPALVGMGISMIGPTLLVHGTEEQKYQYLPKIVSGEHRWCQGFSEPNAGSDLASLRTDAELDAGAERYMINGAKIWTSGAQFANWMFMLVRTDRSSKHNGITFILVDMQTPGIEVRPIRLISGASMFCEVFFQNVAAHVRDVVGGVNQGWTVAKTLLNFERSGMGTGTLGAGARRTASGSAQLIPLAKQTAGEVDGRVADASLRERLAQLLMDELALSLTVERTLAARNVTGTVGPETSMFKLYQSELGQRRDELSLSLRGSDALAWADEGESTTEDSNAPTRMWLHAKATTIWGGTSEIQRNIIAKRVLRLPS